MRSLVSCLAIAATLLASGSVPALAGALDAVPLHALGRRPAPRFVVPQPVQEPVRNTAPTHAATRPSVPAAKISSPAYYNYKALPLVAVDFSRLMTTGSVEQGDGAQPARAGTWNFSGLDGYALMAEKPLADALLAFYEAGPESLWLEDGLPNQRARDAMAVLAEADTYGLVPSDYAVAPPLTESANSPDAVRFEMALSARVLRYLRDASGGRVDPNKLSGYHDFAPKPFDGKAELARMGRAKDIRAALEGAHPRMPEFQRLREALVKARESSVDAVRVDPRLTLKPGESNPELPNFLRAAANSLPADELEAQAALLTAGNTETYSEDLVPVVKAVQKAKGLRPDGVIGPRTVAALVGVSGEQRVEKLEIAMEQLRWLPRALGETRVFINQPAFTAAYTEDGVEKLKMRTVIGSKTHQTTFFYDQIEQVDYNPYWGVPQSIIVNEMLPRLRNDPGYLDRAGYEVTDAKGRKVPSSSVNWGSYGAKVPFNVRQTPSEANALGELKILFPNKHAIYMHDTPSKDLFKRDMRAFSHGCVRLSQPREMAAAVLGTSVEHVAEKLSKGHSTEKVKRQIPVYVAYFTAWPDAAGTVEYFDDVYGRDKHLEEALTDTEAVRGASS